MGTDGYAKNAAGEFEGYEIFIKNLPADTTTDGLQDFFAKAGTIVGPPRLMLTRGLGWLTFSAESGMEDAISWSGCYYSGRRLTISKGKQFHTGVRPSVQAVETHTPALCAEVCRVLVGPNTGGVYVDGTFGRGGHSKAILAALSPSGSLHAFDMDPEAIVAGKALMKHDSRFTIHHAPFSSMLRVLKPLGIRAAGVFFDLGISSPQFDNASRGFRLEEDGPLDLRFDQSQGEPAFQYLSTVSREDLIHVLSTYGEDPIASRRIADAICLARAAGELPTRTRAFAALVANAKGKEYQQMHPAKLTFQALRIHLNDEFEEARKGLRAGFKLVGEGGRIGVLTWKHSECSIVMETFRSLEKVRDKDPMLRWYRAQPDADWLPDGNALTMDDVVRPSARELATNSRARSALLHVMRKRRGIHLAKLEKMCYGVAAWAEVVATAAGEVRKPEKRQKALMIEEPDEVLPTKKQKLGTNTGLIKCREVLRGECNHCGRDHSTKRCTFGAADHERFLLCAGCAPHLPCFWRRFIVPLRSADAKLFDPVDPRGSGRSDVGLRCVSAGLFRSQGLRHSTQVCLSFEQSGHTVEVSGSLARGLVPDEGAMALRLRAGLDVLFRPKRKGALDPKTDPEGWCASLLRGIEAKKRSTVEAVEAALAMNGKPEQVVLVVLDADGMPVREACKQIRDMTSLGGVVTMVGDHRGITAVDVSTFTAVADAVGAVVLRVSLGGTSLLGSHAIVLLQHYFDEMLHLCEVPEQIDFGRSKR